MTYIIKNSLKKRVLTHKIEVNLLKQVNNETASIML